MRHRLNDVSGSIDRYRLSQTSVSSYNYHKARKKNLFEDFTVKDMKTIYNNIITSCGTNSFHILYIVRSVVDSSVTPVCFF